MKSTLMLLHAVRKIFWHQVCRFVVEIQFETISKENCKYEENCYFASLDDFAGKNFFD